jgi:hypothetical protein
VELGRCGSFGSDWAYYFLPGNHENRWLEDESINRARKVHLRIEGTGDDRQSIRLGIKKRPEDAWTWSPVHQLDQPVEWGEIMGLFNYRVDGHHGHEVTGDKVTIEFENARFGSSAFDFEKRGPVNYVRPEVSSVKNVSSKGERWKTMIPDTLDLAARCELALNAYIGCADPTADYEIYWIAPWAGRIIAWVITTRVQNDRYRHLFMIISTTWNNP